MPGRSGSRSVPRDGGKDGLESTAPAPTRSAIGSPTMAMIPIAIWVLASIELIVVAFCSAVLCSSIPPDPRPQEIAQRLERPLCLRLGCLCPGPLGLCLCLGPLCSFDGLQGLCPAVAVHLASPAQQCQVLVPPVPLVRQLGL